MPSHHQATEDNLREVITALGRVDSMRITNEQAQTLYAKQLVIVTLANTQALLAINETLQTIAKGQQ